MTENITINIKGLDAQDVMRSLEQKESIITEMLQRRLKQGNKHIQEERMILHVITAYRKHGVTTLDELINIFEYRIDEYESRT